MSQTPPADLDVGVIRALLDARAKLLARAGVGLNALAPHAQRLLALAPIEAGQLLAIANRCERPLDQLLLLDGGLLELLTGAELERSLGLYVDGPNGPVLAGAWAMSPAEAEHVALRQVRLGESASRLAWVFGLPGSLGLAGISASGHAVLGNLLRPASVGPGIIGSALLRRLLAAPRLEQARAQIFSTALADGRNWMLADGVSFFGYEQLGAERILTRVGRKTGHVHANHCFDPSLRQREARPRSPRSFRRLELASTIYVQRRPNSAASVLEFFAEVEAAAFADADAQAQTVWAVELATGCALWRRRAGDPITHTRFETPLLIDSEPISPWNAKRARTEAEGRVRAVSTGVEKTMSLIERQRAHLFFTWSAQRSARALEITNAERARFEVAGKGWVWDLESQVYNVNVGHRHPHVQARMIEQINALPACAPNAVLEIRATLGELLAKHTGMAKAFLTTGGSEAVENAIKIARLATGRSKIIARRSSYHGATLAVLEIAGDARKQPFAATMRAPLHVDDPHPARAPTSARASDWLESLHELVAREGGETIAAILLEGFTGTNGMQHPPSDFWPGARALCDAHGIMLIDDEIFSGFGRTGRWFARERWGVAVDMMTIGKGLTSGYAPLAGVMVSDALARRFDDEQLWCGLTHYAHPVSCAAAVGSVEVLEREGLPANAQRVGQVFERRFAALIEGHEQVIGQRGFGLMRALELDRGAEQVVAQAWELGVYLPSRGPMIWVCPPLCLRADEAETIADLLEAALVRAA